jgi:hypothetical protein
MVRQVMVRQVMVRHAMELPAAPSDEVEQVMDGAG